MGNFYLSPCENMIPFAVWVSSFCFLIPWKFLPRAMRKQESSLVVLSSFSQTVVPAGKGLVLAHTKMSLCAWCPHFSLISWYGHSRYSYRLSLTIGVGAVFLSCCARITYRSSKAILSSLLVLIIPSATLSIRPSLATHLLSCTRTFAIQTHHRHRRHHTHLSLSLCHQVVAKLLGTVKKHLTLKARLLVSRSSTYTYKTFR